MKKFKPLIIIILLCTATFILLKYFDKNFKLENINIIGESCYTDEQIVSLLVKDKPDGYTYLMYLKRNVFNRIELLPFIEKIDIELIDRNSVNVYVYKKALAGCVRHMGQFMHFDREGTVVESSSVRMDNIPEVTGIEFTKVVLNEKLEIEDDSLFVQLMNMTQLLQKFEIDCSEINFDKRNNITIYFDGNIALLGNRELHDGQLACLKKIIAAGNDQKFKYDLRDWNDEVGEVIGKAIVDTEN